MEVCAGRMFIFLATLIKQVDGYNVRKVSFEKWRKISDNGKFPLNFTCETSEIDGFTCQTPQDVSCALINDDN